MALVHELFPVILDTKYIARFGAAAPGAESYTYHDTALSALFAATEEAKGDVLTELSDEPSFARYKDDDEGVFHEAG